MDAPRAPLILFFVCNQIVACLRRNPSRLIHASVKHWLRVILQPLIDCLHSRVTQLSILLITHVVWNTFDWWCRLTEIRFLHGPVFSAKSRMRIFATLNAANILFNYRKCLFVIHPVTMLIALLQFLKLPAHHSVRELAIIVWNKPSSNLIVVIFIISPVPLNEVVTQYACLLLNGLVSTKLLTLQNQ